MCGAFGFTTSPSYSLKDRFDLEEMDEILESFRFSPHSTIPTISQNSPNRLVNRHWSILPPWISSHKDLKFPTFNARAETLREKKTFSPLWEKAQRCIILASQFYEWKKIKDGPKIVEKIPYTISTSDHLLCFAGLYAVTQLGESATIITTEPNHDLKDIHDRMPVILSEEDVEMWLNKKTPLDEAYSLLQPYPDKELIITEGLPKEAQRGIPKQNPK